MQSTKILAKILRLMEISKSTLAVGAAANQASSFYAISQVGSCMHRKMRFQG